METPSDIVRRGHGLFDNGDYAGAAAAYCAALALTPSAPLCVNVGYSFLMLGDAEHAKTHFERALVLQREFPPALMGLADIHARGNSHILALECYDAALAIDSTLAVAHNNRAQSLFAVGRMREAWRESEWRYEVAGSEALYPHRYSLPRWRGEPLAGRLFVHWEQGFGDMLQYLRFLPLLDELANGYAFECPPPLLRLTRLLLRDECILQASTQPAAIAGFAAQVPLLSLPHVLDVRDDALPSPPYLTADPMRALDLRQRWSESGRRLVGIAWRGSNFDVSRNARLQDFACLRALDLRLVSLQKDATPAERATLADMQAIDASPELADFADTADAIEALDFVVCVDTAVAHLAGAMDKRLWLLLNEPAAVRWMLERDDTPWYPRTTLLRKHAGEVWSGLVQAAANALEGQRAAFPQ